MIKDQNQVAWLPLLAPQSQIVPRPWYIQSKRQFCCHPYKQVRRSRQKLIGPEASP